MAVTAGTANTVDVPEASSLALQAWPHDASQRRSANHRVMSSRDRPRSWPTPTGGGGAGQRGRASQERTRIALGELLIAPPSCVSQTVVNNPLWAWSSDTLMDLTKYQSLKMQVIKVGDIEYLFVESGGFSTRNKPDWTSRWYLLKRP